MRSHPRRPAAASLAAIAALALVALASLPALAKGPILEATLDQPISFQSPPGAELLVPMTITVDEAFEGESIAGAPISMRLVGPTGDTTVAAGSIGRGAGRYEFRITVPEGGPRRLEVFMPGGAKEAEIQLYLTNDPFTFRAMGEGTAQLAPVEPARIPLATKAPAPAPVAPVAAPSDPVVMVAAPPNPAVALGLLALAGVAFVVAVLGTRRRSARRGARPAGSAAVEAPTRASGA